MTINITKHSVFRFISRRGFVNVSNSTFDAWKKAYPDKYKEYEDMIFSEFSHSKFIVESSYKNSKAVRYYINQDTLMVFLVVDNNLITCYCSSYGVGENLDKIILSSLLVGFTQKKIELDRNREITDNLLLEENNNISIKEDMIADLNNKISMLQLEIKTHKSKICEIQGRHSILEKELENIIQKMVRPKNSI